MFFCRANASCAQKLRDILKQYELASGQVINTSKSSIVFSKKAPMGLKVECKQVLGIENEGGCGKYLGLPEHFGRKKKDIFASIIDRMTQKMKSWSSRQLSGAGKLVMLKAVLTAIPNYTMSCFRLPMSLCKRIQSLLVRFWWDANNGKRKMSWVSWKRMAVPKRLGGLGFRDIRAFNDALLAKISWRILSRPNALISRVLLGKYCVESNLRDCSVSNSASHGWRGICAGRDVILKKLVTTLGNGETTNLWTDPWIPSMENFKPIGPCPSELQDARVCTLLSEDKHSWDRDKVCSLFPSLEKQILNIKISAQGAPDTMHWLGTKDGSYSTKSGYFAIMEDDLAETNRLYTRELNWRNAIWGLNCSPKIHIFLWKLFNNALPVGSNLNYRGLGDHITCPRCGLEETTSHVFFECAFAKDVWNLAQWKTHFTPSLVSLDDDVMSVIKLIALPPYGVGKGPLGPWLLWNLWKARNLLVFEKRFFSQVETWSKTIGDAREWLDSQASKTTGATGSRPRDHTDRRLEEATLLYSDAAWSETHETAGLGMSFKDHLTGRVSNHSMVVDFVESPLIGEAMAILEALKRATSLGLLRLHIFSDSKSCVDAINTNSGPRELYGILFDIHSLSSRFDALSFSFIPRTSNVIADSLAKSSLRDYLFDLELLVVP